MERVKIYYSRETDTMDVWFGDPEDEYISEEAGEGLILKKDKDGKIIGIEKLYVSKSLETQHPTSVEVVVS